MNNNKMEVLSPAGDMECLMKAVDFGADAVFLAGHEFGMRTASKNFDADELARAVEYAHTRGSKIYVTCNTLPRNSELARLPDFLSACQHIGVDAFIIADLGVLELAKKYAPAVECHISTQAGIVNYAAANAFYNLGASRVVLAREMSFDEIADIRAHIPSELEIEVFVHGAMCVSFSGRCLISAYMTGRDANRGDCAQPCRWKYHLYEENRQGQYFPVEEKDGGTYLYNSKDMCLIDYIPQLYKAGVSSLKIEGRAKSAYYAAVVTNAYSHAVDGFYSGGCKDDYRVDQRIRQELEKISHREYSQGFYLGGQPGQNTENGGYIRHYDFVATCDSSNGNDAQIIQRNRFFTGDTLDVLPPSGIPFDVVIEKMYNEYGESVDSAPHPMQRLKAVTSCNIPAGSMLRKKRD
ncbi:U32 family peptidase [Ruminococcus sp. zg-921]|uniref:peptidase U32 family protein n=1 Tax=Ruminococcus sp. zg-921 TaxID=2678506 RepID=UPI00210C4411|nr:U32 family peptidase [Ruminococcus sp. zg-921]MCQ4115408.1 U32 family peptidase [Ruminococcus sp. zg-921]